MKMFKLFRCMSKPVETVILKPTKPVYDNTLDYINKKNREMLLFLIKELIGYGDEVSRQQKMENIDDFRCFLTDSLNRGIIPIYFQHTTYLMKEENLKNIVFNELHIDNVVMLIEILKPEESEQSSTN